MNAFIYSGMMKFVKSVAYKLGVLTVIIPSVSLLLTSSMSSEEKVLVASQSEFCFGT